MFSESASSLARQWFSAIHEFWKAVIMNMYEMGIHPEHKKKRAEKEANKDDE